MCVPNVYHSNVNTNNFWHYWITSKSLGISCTVPNPWNILEQQTNSIQIRGQWCLTMAMRKVTCKYIFFKYVTQIQLWKPCQKALIRKKTLISHSKLKWKWQIEAFGCVCCSHVLFLVKIMSWENGIQSNLFLRYLPSTQPSICIGKKKCIYE